MQDHSVADSIRAARVFIIGSALLLAGAVLGLNSWPLGKIAGAAWSLSGRDVLLASSGLGFMFVVMFWGSRPSIASQWIVVLFTPVLFILLWHLFDAELHFSWIDTDGFPAPMLLVTAMAIPSALFLLGRLPQARTFPTDPVFESRLRYLVILSLLFLMVPHPALTLTGTLHPHTYDLYAMHWDRVAGLNIAPALIDFVDSMPFLPEFVRMAYGMTPVGFLAVAVLHLRNKPPHVASALLTWVVLTACALVAYNFFPICGPSYLFDGASYAVELRNAANFPLKTVSLPPFPRNGMPSMHFGWLLAASILWWRSGTAWWSRALLITVTSLTAIATIYLGEHYLVDLIVAVPFVLGVIGLCTTAVPFSAPQRHRTVFAGFATWFAWIVLLRTSIHFIVEHPWLCWVMILATVAIVVLQARWISQLKHLVAPTAVPLPKTADAPTVSLERKLGLMFFASGAAALVYQVLFAKQLALVFGSTATATFTVLATFLGGMAIGSLIGGRLALRVTRPLLTYAFIEMFIAVYCILTPALFTFIQHAYVAMAVGQAPDAPLLLGLRVVLGAVVLLVPTVLMGATLPLLTQVLGARLRRIGTKVAWLYFANTSGAAVGALLTSYVVIPGLGVSRTTLVAAMLNLLVALGAIELAKRLPAADSSLPAEDEGQAGAPLPKRAATAALLSLGIGGVLSLGLEVVYVHMLSIVAGNSVYAFGLMLATFLVGLAGGGETARRLLLNQDNDRIRMLVWSLLGLAASVAAAAWWWNDIPEYFASFAQHPVARTFASREAIRGGICALLMVPPTIFIGAAYTFGIDIATTAGRGRPVATLGIGAAANTLGNIAGVLLFGFGLLPAIGGMASIRTIALGAVVVAAVVMLITATKLRRGDAVAFVGTIAILGASLFARLDYDMLSSGANVYFYPQRWGKTIDHAESIDGGLTTVALFSNAEGQHKTLLTNGKFQGNNAMEGEMQAQIGFALAPLLHQEKRDRALVIGYGTGVTSRVFHEAGFRELEIAELSRDVVRLADAHFAEVNKQVSSAPGVKLNVTDGRNLLLLYPPEKRFDVVSIEITSIWFAGAAALYNRDFYSLVRSRMASDGVLQQWVQLHRLSTTDILTVIASLRAEFQYVSLYVIGRQGILIATNDATKKAPQPSAMAVLDGAPGLAAVKSILDRPLGELTQDRLLDDAGVDRFLKGVGIDERIWLSTDDNLRLEYSTPKANVNNSQLSYDQNLDLLSRFRGQ